jgi:glucose dehydrogenase
MVAAATILAGLTSLGGSWYQALAATVLLPTDVLLFAQRLAPAGSATRYTCAKDQL